MVEIAIDTASEIAGVALGDAGRLVSELTWHTRRNHSRELLPALDGLLRRSGLSRADISALLVCLGPGSYAGLRVGLSTAKGLAYALDIPIGGVGRLACDAWPHAFEPGRRVIAVHAAGRAELAWAVYSRAGGQMQEVSPPRLSPREAFPSEVRAGDVVCGELDQEIVESVEAKGATWTPPHPARVLAVLPLGWQRLQAGDIDSVDALVPLYLREPAIGPQPPVPRPPSPAAGRAAKGA